MSDKTDERTPAWRNVLLRVVISTAAGLLIYFSGPPRTLWWLAPIGFAILGAVIYGARARAGFGYTLCAGLGFTVPLLAWTGEFVGVVAWLPLALLEAALMGLAGAAISVVSVLRAWPVWAALVWVAGEYLRSIFPFGGFPWARIAFTQPDGVFLPLATVGGTPLIGLAVALTGFGLTMLVRTLLLDRRPRRIVAPALAVVLPVVAAFGALPLVGTDANDGEATVAVVQGNVPRAGLDFNAQRRAVLDNHVARTEQLAQDVRAGKVDQPDLVIWPENSSDIDPYRNPDAWARIDDAARAIKAPIAVGSVLLGDDGLPRNTILLWDPQRGPIEQYTKRKLQPFGETMPMRSFFRLFTSAVDRAGQFVPGEKAVSFRMGDATVGFATCYEVAFDGVVRESVEGTNLLAVPTNNATFGYTEMTYQQLAMDRVRAVEHGRAVAVAATSGVSAFVRPDGSVSQSTGMFVPGALVETVPLRTTTTLSDQLGPVPEWIMVLAGLGAVGVAIAARRRARTSN
ncbi:apolipoprotein N-acyltransferase [Actinophytocola algeriensis]|uniref:Apolipoprotein N-acyltransferase n=1 Tax=Actinophytocola algeriensis TaxID=1768010 RepID=A0A7W7Q260_9PSEU|nr:apolipoprotein N-acyltransferase [Actinophytocola algeriensis]MBB4905645.1 apolipoprotein N-acyltransferase [Actinophytocola algeriensis]MBE1472670.1 apolipoprotein N-acyltransferase [Actinophytocola algeriensis]